MIIGNIHKYNRRTYDVHGHLNDGEVSLRASVRGDGTVREFCELRDRIVTLRHGVEELPSVGILRGVVHPVVHDDGDGLRWFCVWRLVPAEDWETMAEAVAQHLNDGGCDVCLNRPSVQAPLV